jgi:hypothetical protein
MNKRLKELARQAKPNLNLIWEDADLERFAELVRDDERGLCAKSYFVIVDQIRKDEREACAKLCDARGELHGGLFGSWAQDISERIRARGEPSPTFKNYMDDNWAGIV